MASVVVGLLCFIGAVLGAPTKTYDQRQQGELNIHAQLDNIVVVVIPSAKLNLLQLATSTKYSGEKGGFFQALQKLHKDIERYENLKDEDKELTNDSQNDIKTELSMPLITSDHEEKTGEKEEEKEEEVAAVVEEMKPETTEKLETSKIHTRVRNEQSIGNEGVQHSMLTVTIPVEVKDVEKKVEDKTKDISSTLEKVSEKEKELTPLAEVNSEENTGLEQTSSEKIDLPEKEAHIPPKEEETSEKEAHAIASSHSSESGSSESSSAENVNPSIEAMIKPAAVKEEITAVSSMLKKTSSHEPAESSFKKTSEPVKLQEGVRKEKVIKYKPDTKWAPGLVDLMGPSRRSKELQERQRFAELCSPGDWDPELKTCIMPGESRSRSDLARFLQTMRFGLIHPSQ